MAVDAPSVGKCVVVALLADEGNAVAERFRAVEQRVAVAGGGVGVSVGIGNGDMAHLPERASLLLAVPVGVRVRRFKHAVSVVERRRLWLVDTAENVDRDRRLAGVSRSARSDGLHLHHLNLVSESVGDVSSEAASLHNTAP